MNPITWLTYYLGRRLDIYSIRQKFLVGRKARSISIYGPGCLFITGDSIIRDCSFMNCDYFAVPPSTVLFAAHEVRRTHLENCRLIGLTIVFPEEAEEQFRKGIVREGAKLILTSPISVPVAI